MKEGRIIFYLPPEVARGAYFSREGHILCNVLTSGFGGVQWSVHR